MLGMDIFFDLFGASEGCWTDQGGEGSLRLREVVHKAVKKVSGEYGIPEEEVWKAG